jgi:hypothetical protein
MLLLTSRSPLTVARDRPSKEEGQFGPTAYTPWLGSRERTSSERMLPSVIGHDPKVRPGSIDCRRAKALKLMRVLPRCFPDALSALSHKANILFSLASPLGLEPRTP